MEEAFNLDIKYDLLGDRLHFQRVLTITAFRPAVTHGGPCKLGSAARHRMDK
jgi:hypothetical protein